MAVQTFKLPKSLKEGAKFSFCPGCDHGVAVRILAEVLDELGLTENTITATSIGCSVTIYDFINVDAIEAPRQGSCRSYRHKKSKTRQMCFHIPR